MTNQCDKAHGYTRNTKEVLRERSENESSDIIQIQSKERFVTHTRQSIEWHTRDKVYLSHTAILHFLYTNVSHERIQYKMLYTDLDTRLLTFSLSGAAEASCLRPLLVLTSKWRLLGLPT